MPKRKTHSMLVRSLTFDMHEKTGVVALVLSVLAAHTEVRGLSFKSTVFADGRCHNMLLVGVDNIFTWNNFKKSFRKAINAVDTASDPAQTVARRLPLPGQEVYVRLKLSDNEVARSHLQVIASKQAYMHIARMREFEANVDRWTATPENDPLVVKMLLIVENSRDAEHFANFVCDLAKYCKHHNMLMSMHRPAEPIYNPERTPMEFDEVCEWLGYAPDTIRHAKKTSRDLDFSTAQSPSSTDVRADIEHFVEKTD